MVSDTIRRALACWVSRLLALLGLGGRWSLLGRRLWLRRRGPGRPWLGRGGRGARLGGRAWSVRRTAGAPSPREIGHASCRERVCQDVSISLVAVSLKKKRKTQDTNTTV